MRSWVFAALWWLLLPQGGRALHAAPRHKAAEGIPDQEVLPGPEGDNLGKLFKDMGQEDVDAAREGEDLAAGAPPDLGVPLPAGERLGDLDPDADDDEAYVSSFLSDSGMLCTEGAARNVAAHLATYKASPLGSAYLESIPRFRVTCKARGYTKGQAQDPCSDNGRLSFSVRKADDAAGIAETRRGFLDRWRTRHKVDANMSSLLAACSCHPRSEVYKARHLECATLQTPGSWLHFTPLTIPGASAMTCYEGSFEYALRALATMKSTPFVVVHESDLIIPKRCAEVGYASAVGAMDQCFPKLRLMRSSARASADDSQRQALAWSTSSFFNRIEEFKKMVKEKDLDSWGFGSQVNGCQCLPKSAAALSLESKKATCGMPPVRDYWKG